MKIAFIPQQTYRTAPIHELRRGAVFMNTYHDPQQPRENAGLYLALTFGAIAKGSRHEPFAVNLRSGALYTYSQLTSRMRGPVYLCDAELTTSIQRVENV